MAPGGLVVADSSVWVDFLSRNETPQATKLSEWLQDGATRICLIDLILTEVLRGLPTKEATREVASNLLLFPYLEARSPTDHLEAASIFQEARSAGVTVRGTVDLLIATVCIGNDALLLHSDRDFDNLARVSDLKVWEPSVER